MPDDVDERLSRRFGGEQDEESSDIDRGDENNNRSMNECNDANDGDGGETLNVKRDWNARSFYLPNSLDRELSTAYKRLDLGLAEDNADLTLKKTRHYYPLVFELGLECMECIEREELKERIEKREREEGD